MPPVSHPSFESDAAGRRVAKLSGAALGYIHGNLPGAYAGYKLGGQIHSYRNKVQQMAPISRKRKHGGAFSATGPRDTARSNKRPAFMGTVVNRNPLVLRRGFKMKPRRRARGRRGSNQNDVDVRRKGSKVAREGRNKSVRVPKRLRKQIKQVIKGGDPLGIFEEISYETPIYFNDNQQSVAQHGYISQSLQCLFDPVGVLNAASILWNRKTPTVTRSISDPGNFPPQNFKIWVEDSWAQFTYRNNTARTMFMKLYDFSLKSSIPRAAPPNTTAYPGALANWVAFGQQQAPTAAGDSTFSNALSITPSMLYNSPKFAQGMNATYTTDCTSVTLEPGKEYKHILKGPKNKIYDFMKFWYGGNNTEVEANFINPQKFTKEHVVVVYLDINTTTLGTVGRTTDIALNSPYALLCETRTFHRLRMPEQAGVTVTTPAVGTITTVPLGHRVYRYAIQNWAVAQSGVVTVIEDENPQAPTTVGV